jgi:hypothetical protein
MLGAQCELTDTGTGSDLMGKGFLFISYRVFAFREDLPEVSFRGRGRIVRAL